MVDDKRTTPQPPPPPSSRRQSITPHLSMLRRRQRRQKLQQQHPATYTTVIFVAAGTMMLSNIIIQGFSPAVRRSRRPSRPSFRPWIVDIHSTYANCSSSSSSSSSINNSINETFGSQITTSSFSSSSSSTLNLEPLVVCGPSGVGKGTVIEGLMDAFMPNKPFGFCVSHTTRSPRPGEMDGIHYFFTSMDEFQSDIERGEFVEHAVVHGNYYGTSQKAVQQVQAQEKIAILDIDVQGVKAVKVAFGERNTPAKYIFIAPPSMEELERRLRGRGTETEDAIQRRLGNAAREVDYGNQVGNFDHVLVNSEVEETVEEMVGVLKHWYPQLS